MATDKTKGQTLYFSQWGGERPIPDVFIAAMERAEERTSGYVADAEISQDVKDDVNVVDAYFDTRERRTNEKTLVVVRKKDGNITLREYRTTDQGQTVQVDATLFYTTDSNFAHEYPSSTQDVSVKDLGNRWSIQEVAVMGTWVDGVFTPGLYQGIELTTRKDDPVGGPFTVGVDEEQTQIVTEGTVEQPILTGDQLVGQQRQIAQSQKLTSTTTRDPVTLPKTEEYSAELLDLLPPRFRALLVTYKITIRQTGVVAQPSLATGDLVKTEKQVTAVTKLVETLTRAGATFPISITDTATITEYGGGKVNIVSSIAVNGTYTDDEGEGVVSSKVTKLGEGHELKETVTRVAGAWPTRVFADLDETTRTLIAGTKQVVAKGATTAGVSGDVVTEVKDIDGYREDKIIRTFPTVALDAYGRVLHTNTNVELPAVLQSVTAYMQIHGGNGSYSESGTYAMEGNGSGGVDLSGNAQASAAIIPEVGEVIRTYNGNNLPCYHVLFLAAFGSSRAALLTLATAKLGLGTVNDWPRFSPQPIVILCTGQTSSIKVNATQRAHSATRVDYLGVIKTTGESRSAGTGVVSEVGVDIAIKRISPCIHGTLSIVDGGSHDLPTTYAAVATIASGAAGLPSSTAVTAYAGVSGSTGFIQGGSATPGTTAVPSSGLYAHRVVTEVDEVRNRVKVLVEVVDASNFA